MSNATKTSKTKLIAVRMPLDLVEYAEAQEGSLTALVVDTLRHAWNLPEPEQGPPASYWAA